MGWFSAGKTGVFAKPNIMNGDTGFVVIEPKGGILHDALKILGFGKESTYTEQITTCPTADNSALRYFRPAWGNRRKRTFRCW